MPKIAIRNHDRRHNDGVDERISEVLLPGRWRRHGRC
jgi:hypothetical protein